MIFFLSNFCYGFDIRYITEACIVIRMYKLKDVSERSLNFSVSQPVRPTGDEKGSVKDAAAELCQ